MLAISRLSTTLLVMEVIKAWASSRGIATSSPSAVVFMATEMEADNSSAFCAGSAEATALKAVIKPIMVPSKRSEERRVGKEWRCRWSPGHEKQKIEETRSRGREQQKGA